MARDDTERARCGLRARGREAIERLRSSHLRPTGFTIGLDEPSRTATDVPQVHVIPRYGAVPEGAVLPAGLHAVIVAAHPDDAPLTVGGPPQEEIDAFWSIVDRARATAGTDDSAFLEAVEAALHGLSREKLVSFYDVQYWLHGQAYRNDPWAAGRIMNGYCSDDGFDDFRSWLIARGRAVYEAALADPDSLVSSIPMEGRWPIAEFEGFRFVAFQVHVNRFGERPPQLPLRPAPDPGPDWDERTIDSMLPKLHTRVVERARNTREL